MEFDPKNVEIKINGVVIEPWECEEKEYRIYFIGVSGYKKAKEIYDRSNGVLVRIGLNEFPVIKFDDEDQCIVIKDIFNQIVGNSNISQ